MGGGGSEKERHSNDRGEQKYPGNFPPQIPLLERTRITGKGNLMGLPFCTEAREGERVVALRSGFQLYQVYFYDLDVMSKSRSYSLDALPVARPDSFSFRRVKLVIEARVGIDGKYYCVRSRLAVISLGGGGGGGLACRQALISPHLGNDK